ncbi:hypothetical protein HDR58_02635 [bacterium]|nr:hypothetical protein [bacterium]
MNRKKNIIIAAVAVALMTGVSAVKASTSNNLLQMDVRRSSAANTVDVTFYTTGDSTNSVVTRKSNNRYVVLLPNVSGSSSVIPGIGGVKDLITDIDVKNVNDGIGGYTKITFGTTKPINIKTSIKKTSPLTQTQKDYKALIAQNNQQASTQTQQVKTSESTQSAKATPATTAPAVSTQPKAQQTKTVQVDNNVKAAQKTQTPTQTSKTQSTPKISLTPINLPKVKIEPPKIKQEQVKPKVEPQKIVDTPKVETPKVAKSALTTSVDNYVPKMKFDENGKRHIDLEPRVSHEIVKEKSLENIDFDNVSNNVEQSSTLAEQNVQSKDSYSAVETPQDTQKSNNFPVWILIAGGSAALIAIFFLGFDAFSHSNKKNQERLKSFFNQSSKNQVRRRNREYQDIIDDDTLNWQERYKKYAAKDKELHPTPVSNDISYVTDMSGTKKAIVAPKNDVESKKDLKQPSTLNFSNVTDSIKNIPSENEEKRAKLQAKISQMEHSLAQTPSLEPSDEVKSGVRSEDDTIMNSLSDIKLKSFAKDVSLKQTQRSLLEDDKKVSRNKSFKEGRFVKLKNSPLSVNKRNSAATDLEVSDIMNSGSKYLTNNGEMKMSKEKENYLLSSLDEYLSILDDEKTSSAKVAETLSQVQPSAMSRSGITNPISRASNPMAKQEIAHSVNGLIVKSGYNISSDKGFYLVNLDGVSALVGRVKDNVVILKKFDHVVDKPLQVRQDYGSVYIVKAGGYKCLVDVAKDKMGTLIEI